MATKTDNGIVSYFHCKNCITEGKQDKIAVGWTKKGLQVWCDACNTNVLALDFGGQKVTTDINPKEDGQKT